MIRGIKQKHIIALFIVSLALAGVINLAFRSFAAISLTVSPIKPRVNGTQITGSEGYTTGTSNVASVQFQATGNSPKGIGIRIIWRKKGNSNWCNFATTNKSTPYGISVPCSHGSDSKLNIHGWKNVDTSGSIVLANSGTTITFPAVSLAPGTYEWSAQSITRDSAGDYYYGDPPVWTAVQTLTIKVPTYIVTATVNPSGSGSVSGSGTVNAGGSKNLVASPASGYKFTNWTGNCSGTSLSFTLTSITSNKACTANFIKTTNPPMPVKTNPKSNSTSKNQTTQPASTNIAAPVEDTIPPSIPEHLEANYVVNENSVSLIWDASSDENGIVEGYEVERKLKTETEWKKTADVVAEEYTDFDFIPNSVYEYRVRAFDQKKNYSEYSNVVETTTGEFKPNVTSKDGGNVTDAEEKVSVGFPSNAVPEDVYILIEKGNPKELKNVSLSKNTRIVGDSYTIRAKNSKGEEIKNFKTQVVMRFKTVDLRGVNEKSIKLATLTEDQKVTFLHTSFNSELNTVETLTDHFSVYFMTAPTMGFWVIFFKVVAWILIISGVIAGGYFGYKKYRVMSYQKEHKEDYIYKH